jgi:predicted adenine nucleotide alpha hydrolase (AANH) superfamily ATPase
MLRLKKTFELAEKEKYDFFSTTLSISPHKDAKRLNDYGISLSQESTIKWLYSDFKKKNGYKRSCELSKEYGLYRQDYCGCVFSKRERETGNRNSPVPPKPSSSE